MTELFQTGLFGYSKKSVSTYISNMNEDFAQKLLEKDRTYKDVVRELREEVEQLRQENERLRAEREEVAGALIDAKAFAASLIRQSEEADRTQRAKNAALHQVEFQQIQTFAANIDSLRKAFRSVLCDMDEELERYEIKCQAIQAEFCPDKPGSTEGAARREAYDGQESVC